MTKKNFIALADAIREHNEQCGGAIDWIAPFEDNHLYTLANCLESNNPNFDRQLWLDYIAGKCGPRGGKLK